MTTEILLALIGLATILARWGASRWRASDAVERELLAGAEIQDTLDRTLVATGCDRISINFAHNGGSVPSLGDAMWSSTRWESRKSGSTVPPLLNTWQNRPLDAISRRTLRRIVTSRFVVAKRRELPPGQLRETLKSQGVETTLSVRIVPRIRWWEKFVRSPQTKWGWLCCDWVQDFDPDNNQTQAMLQCAAHVAHVIRRGKP